ncbi:hypothetical protein BLA34_16855 [Ralstonia solanacearum]|nr:hypothetical protein BLA34_16855 [Ralstonia solanacearum]
MVHRFSFYLHSWIRQTSLTRKSHQNISFVLQPMRGRLAIIFTGWHHFLKLNTPLLICALA